MGGGSGGGISTGGGQGGGNPNCNASSCANGCCAPNGDCVTLLSQSNLVCGHAGETCGPCTGASGMCNTATGTCQPAQTCGPGNCSGCCDGDTCLSSPQQNNSKCGGGGTACIACQGSNTCSNGACQAPTCSASNCLNGCCNMNGTNCVPHAAQSSGVCGTQGNACAPCPQGQACNIAGQCVATAALGSPCTQDSACASVGATAFCKKTTTRGVTYPQGYCTLPCTTAGVRNCGPNDLGDCRGGDDDPEFFGYGESEHFCVAPCPSASSQSTCRSGYYCYGESGQRGVCWLNPPPAYSPGTPSNKVGNACTLESQCEGPPDPVYGYCVPPHDGGMGGSFYPQGYCTADCAADFTGTVCGTNAFCGFEGDTNGDLTGAAACFQKCTLFSGKTETRAGYACWTASRPDGGQQGMVFPSCEAVPSICPAGYTCNTTNGYCCDVMNNCLTGLNYFSLN